MTGGDYATTFATSVVSSGVGSALEPLAKQSIAAYIAFDATIGGVTAEVMGGNFWEGFATSLMIVGLNHCFHLNKSSWSKDDVKDRFPKIDKRKARKVLKELRSVERKMNRGTWSGGQVSGFGYFPVDNVIEAEQFMVVGKTVEELQEEIQNKLIELGDPEGDDMSTAALRTTMEIRSAKTQIGHYEPTIAIDTIWGKKNIRAHKAYETKKKIDKFIK